MSNHSPTVPLCRMFKCTSEGGNVYFRGRLGNARIVMLKAREPAEDGGEVWNVLLSEAPNTGGAARGEPKPQAKASAVAAPFDV